MNNARLQEQVDAHKIKTMRDAWIIYHKEKKSYNRDIYWAIYCNLRDGRSAIHIQSKRRVAVVPINYSKNFLSAAEALKNG